MADQPEEPRKGIITLGHQVVTFILFPLIVAAVMWGANKFNEMQIKVEHIDTVLTDVQAALADHGRKLDGLLDGRKRASAQ